MGPPSTDVSESPTPAGGSASARRRTHVKSRLPWTTQEDDALRQLVEKYGLNNWNDIASCMPGRSSKSCSLRWRCYLDPTVTHPSDAPFSPWETAVIFVAQSEMGNKWTDIARMVNGRSNSAVKNHWNVQVKELFALGALDNSFLEAGLSLEELLALEEPLRTGQQDFVVPPNSTPWRPPQLYSSSSSPAAARRRPASAGGGGLPERSSGVSLTASTSVRTATGATQPSPDTGVRLVTRAVACPRHHRVMEGSGGYSRGLVSAGSNSSLLSSRSAVLLGSSRSPLRGVEGTGAAGGSQPAAGSWAGVGRCEGPARVRVGGRVLEQDKALQLLRQMQQGASVGALSASAGAVMGQQGSNSGDSLLPQHQQRDQRLPPSWQAGGCSGGSPQIGGTPHPMLASHGSTTNLAASQLPFDDLLEPCFGLDSDWTLLGDRPKSPFAPDGLWGTMEPGSGMFDFDYTGTAAPAHPLGLSGSSAALGSLAGAPSSAAAPGCDGGAVPQQQQQQQAMLVGSRSMGPAQGHGVSSNSSGAGGVLGASWSKPEQLRGSTSALHMQYHPSLVPVATCTTVLAAGPADRDQLRSNGQLPAATLGCGAVMGHGLYGGACHGSSLKLELPDPVGISRQGSCITPAASPPGAITTATAAAGSPGTTAGTLGLLPGSSVPAAAAAGGAGQCPGLLAPPVSAAMPADAAASIATVAAAGGGTADVSAARAWLSQLPYEQLLTMASQVAAAAQSGAAPAAVLQPFESMRSCSSPPAAVHVKLEDTGAAARFRAPDADAAVVTDGMVAPSPSITPTVPVPVPPARVAADHTTSGSCCLPAAGAGTGGVKREAEEALVGPHRWGWRGAEPEKSRW